MAVIGPNGAGKSTLLRTIGRAVTPDGGSLRVLDRAWAPDRISPYARDDLRRHHKEIGQVMQGLHLVSRLTARENVIVGALARPGAISPWRGWTRLYPARIRAEADAALRSVGLADHAETRTDCLSGGERQKVCIARLQLQRPRLILADEPTSALDPGAAAQACTALRYAATSATLITVVHQASLLPMLADRVIGMASGGVQFDLPRDQVDAGLLDRLYRMSHSSGFHPFLE